jgi:hypothetical protein
MMIFQKWFRWLIPSRSLDQLEREFAKFSPVPTNYVSPHPQREQDQVMEFISQPVDGERSPQTQQITRELTGGLISERER